MLLLKEGNFLFCNFLFMYFCLFKIDGGLYYRHFVFDFLMLFLKFQAVSNLKSCRLIKFL